jgi:uncharacterized membrane protein
MTARARRYERGQLLPLFALMIIVLVGMATLGVDVGYWRYQQRVEQTAADSAAIAGADELNYPVAADWSTAAKNAASANGYVADGGVTTTVTATNPPASGTYAGNASAVQVVISRKQPVFFSGAFGLAPQWINAQAVAVTTTTGRNCLYALGTGSNAINVQGATITAPNCGIASNGGITLPGATVTASAIGYVIGPYSYNGQSYPEAQPLAEVASVDQCPSIRGCAYLKANPPHAGACLNANPQYASAQVMQPGRYCTTLNVTGTSITFNPGVYEFDNGLNANASMVTGNGVTLYNGTTGQLEIQSANINLSAPTSGNTQGVTLYQNPANTTQFIVQGGTTKISGLMYFPSANVQSNGATNTWSLLICLTFQLLGNSLSMPSATYAGFSHAALVQ